MPPKNPLFRELPPLGLVLGILEKLQIHVSHTFTRSQIDFDLALNIIEDLKPYYFICKSEDLFREINEKRLITILRQCLKVHNYILKGRETTRSGRKVVEYIITKNEEEILDEAVVISFD
jgi:hypothetical protein